MNKYDVFKNGTQIAYDITKKEAMYITGFSNRNFSRYIGKCSSKGFSLEYTAGQEKLEEVDVAFKSAWDYWRYRINPKARQVG